MNLNKVVASLVDQLKGSVPVYAQVPEGAQYPYITIELDDLTFGELKHVKHKKMFCNVKVKGWSQYKGTLQIIQIIEHIRDSLANRIMVFDKESKGSSFCKDHKLQLLKDGSTRVYEAIFQLNIRSC